MHFYSHAFDQNNTYTRTVRNTYQAPPRYDAYYGGYTTTAPAYYGYQPSSNGWTIDTPAPRLALEYIPMGEDQAQNSAAGWHPRHLETADSDKMIRLLKVLPRQSTDATSEIKCYFMDSRRFATKAFWDRVKYTALSYTWGPATTSAHVNWIRINDRKVCVRRNLWDFLHTMQVEQNEGPFWIVALCIDQLDRQEKSRQLKLMPRIYEKAAVVLVWLGKPETLPYHWMPSIS